MGSAFSLACGVLMLMRFFVPAESAEDGETLGIVIAWLSLALLTVWIALRTDRYQWLPTRPDGAVVLLALTQVIAALRVVWTASGNQRAAINMLWEWIGVAVAFLLLRVYWRRDSRCRRRLTGLLLSAGLLLAGLGLWQRYVWYPQIQSAYREWLELSAAEPGVQARSVSRKAELERELGPELISLTGSSQVALKQRVLDSTEPFGRFGLANTFAGCLAVMVLLLVGQRPRTGRAAWATWGLAVGLVGLTLLLTRSRTAWLATLCGLVWWMSTQRSLWGDQSGRIRVLRKLAIAALAIVPLGALSLMFGAVDRQELVEAPKSVQYRLQYWTATWPMIRQHPLFGVGPGNFRQHYLQFKLPEASEEISDPHNLVLDLWAAGGVLGLLGLLAVGWPAWKQWRYTLTTLPADADESSVVQGPDWAWLLIVGWLTCGLLFFAEYLFHNRIDREVLWLGLGWLPVVGVVDRLQRSSRSGGTSFRSASAAALALGVHLLTSGGISMPVVILLWLMLLFILGDDGHAAVPSPFQGNRPIGGRLALTAALLLAAGLWSGWGPSTISSMQLAAGRSALYLDHRPSEAAELFREATKSDPRDPEAWRELTFAEAMLWQRGGRNAEQHFQAARQAADRMVAADPVNPHAYRVRGELWKSRYRRSLDKQDAQHAADEFRLAAGRYPNSPSVQLELAQALHVADDNAEARVAAQRALELNQLYVQHTHFDKTLSESDVSELQQLADPTP
ncbi:MAG: O-antigen ligase family protein [Planctomycetaceae bacterium]